MATTIKLKNGSGAPLTGDLVQGEPALDLTNKRLYTEDSGGSVIEVGTNPTSLTTGTFTSTGIDDNATSTAITIDASDNVGIGNSSPSDAYVTAPNLVLGNTSDTFSGMTLFTSAAGSQRILFADGTTGTDNRVGQLSYDHSDNSMAFSTNTSERMRINSSGNVGIDVTPSAWGSLFTGVQIGSSASLYGFDSSVNGDFVSLSNNIYEDNSDKRYIRTDPASSYVQDNGTHRWLNAASGSANTVATLTERMRIDASGNLMVGTTTAGGANAVTLNSTGAVNAFGYSFPNNNGAALDTGIRRATTNTMVFDTASTERMRIDASGNLLVGTTTNLIWNTTNLTGCVIGGNASSGGFSSIQVSRASDLCLLLNRLTSDGQIQAFARQGTQVGEITVTTSATSYNTSSDYRLKENIADADDAGSKIDAIKVRKFDWKADGSHQDYGMVAQELMTVAPEAVSVPEDPEKMMGVDYSKLVPMLIKEVQSLRARVAQLES